MKNIVGLSLFLLLLISCGDNESSKSSETADSATVKKRIGLALGLGGLGDLSYNDMLYKGLIEVSKKYDVEVAYRVPKSDTPFDIEQSLVELIEVEKCDFIIGGAGWLMIEPLDTLSKKYSNVRFVLMDDYAKPSPNVASAIFRQNEGSYVVGALSAYLSKSGTVGFIGGVDIDVIKSFLVGYEAGLYSVRPDIRLLVEYCSTGDDFSGFGNPKRAHELAISLYNKGAEIIYAVAGASGIGVIEAAKERKKWAIGVDYNQDYLAQGFVLTSMMKRLDNAIVDITGLYLSNRFNGNQIYYYGYHNDGIGITEMEFTKDKIPDNVLKIIRRIEKQIASGEIRVPDYSTPK